VSAKAQKAVEDALVVASVLQREGRPREAEIIRRLCRSNSSYRVTLGQLWRDNMALRGETEHPATSELSDAVIGDNLAGLEADVSPNDKIVIVEKVHRPVVEKRPRADHVEPEWRDDDYAGWRWCEQCDRRVSPAKAIMCESRFCKAKQEAA
jgi:hypothetical protein